MYIIGEALYFPLGNQANSDGIIAIGGDLSIDRLLLAYKNGIFPWYNDDEPIIWWCPEERMVVDIMHYKIPRSIQKILNKNTFTITYNTCFETVMRNCQQIVRKDQDGTWIQNSMISAYTALNRINKAWSVEVWLDNELVGGIYGVKLHKVFCGESMFSKVPNASKIAFVALIQKLKSLHFLWLDCQIYNDHLAMLGAYEIPRASFLDILATTENS